MLLRNKLPTLRPHPPSNLAPPTLCSERKNVNLPGVIVDLPTLTEKDIDDLVNWVRAGCLFGTLSLWV